MVNIDGQSARIWWHIYKEFFFFKIRFEVGRMTINVDRTVLWARVLD